MLDDLTYSVVQEALRVLFLVGIPVVVALAVAGTLISALQSVTTINDVATAYAVRLIALVVVLYLLFANFSESVLLLAEHAWKG